MLNRYKVRLNKKYDFELDGKSEEDVREQVEYIMSQIQLLDMPYVKKRVRLRIKKSHERGVSNNEKDN